MQWISSYGPSPPPDRLKLCARTRLAWAAAALALLGPGAAGAVDLEEMSVSQRKIYCLVYLDLDAQVQVEEGRMTPAEHQKLGFDLAYRLLGHNLSTQGGGLQSRINTAFESVISANPSLDEVAATARACEALLRL